VSLYADRTTPLGEIINKYLRKEMELDDRAAHLLFSANRWELRYDRRQTN
jgi:dTMP kinase